MVSRGIIGLTDAMKPTGVEAPVAVLAGVGLAPNELGLPAALAVLLLMDAGVPIPVPTDLLLLVVGERAAAGAFPAWAAAIGLEVVAIVSTTLLFFALRGPANAVISRVGHRVGLTPSRMGWATSLLERRGSGCVGVGASTPGLRSRACFAYGPGALGASCYRAAVGGRRSG